MSRYERTGKRSLAWSAWHRNLPRAFSMIDIDSCLYCDRCKEPLALIETVHGNGTVPKSCEVTRRLATLAKLPSFLLYYSEDAAGKLTKFARIAFWRSGQVGPLSALPASWNPTDWRAVERGLREKHQCQN